MSYLEYFQKLYYYTSNSYKLLNKSLFKLKFYLPLFLLILFSTFSNSLYSLSYADVIPGNADAVIEIDSLHTSYNNTLAMIQKLDYGLGEYVKNIMKQNTNSYLSFIQGKTNDIGIDSSKGMALFYLSGKKNFNANANAGFLLTYNDESLLKKTLSKFSFVKSNKTIAGFPYYLKKIVSKKSGKKKFSISKVFATLLKGEILLFSNSKKTLHAVLSMKGKSQAESDHYSSLTDSLAPFPVRIYYNQSKIVKTINQVLKKSVPGFSYGLSQKMEGLYKALGLGIKIQKSKLKISSFAILNKNHPEYENWNSITGKGIPKIAKMYPASALAYTYLNIPADKLLDMVFKSDKKIKYKYNKFRKKTKMYLGKDPDKFFFKKINGEVLFSLYSKNSVLFSLGFKNKTSLSNFMKIFKKAYYKKKKKQLYSKKIGKKLIYFFPISKYKKIVIFKYSSYLNIASDLKVVKKFLKKKSSNLYKKNLFSSKTAFALHTNISELFSIYGKKAPVFLAIFLGAIQKINTVTISASKEENINRFDFNLDLK